MPDPFVMGRSLRTHTVGKPPVIACASVAKQGGIGSLMSGHFVSGSFAWSRQLRARVLNQTVTLYKAVIELAAVTPLQSVTCHRPCSPTCCSMYDPHITARYGRGLICTKEV